MRRSAGALAALLTGKLAWQLVLARRGLVAASGDDFLRTLIALDWAHSPFLKAWRYAELSWAWLPLPLWLNGSLLRVWARPDLVPRLSSAILSTLSLALLWATWTKVWGNRLSMPAVLMTAAIPWHLWLGGAATAQPLFHCLVAGALLLACDHTPSRLVGAGLLAGLGAVTRPEGWQFVLLWVIWLMIGARRASARARMVSAGLACAFPLAWVLIWWREAGSPFLLLRAGASYQELAAGGAPSPLVNLLQFPFILLVTSPLLMIACMVGLVRQRRHLAGPEIRHYAWFSLGFAATGFVVALMGMGTTSAPQRYALLPLALLVPFAAHAVRAGTRRWLLAGLMAAIGLWGSRSVPRQYTFLWEVGREVGNLIDEGKLPPETIVCGQEAWDDLTKVGSADRSPVTVCEEWGLAVATRRPGQVVCSRRGGFLSSEGEPSCRGLTYGELGTAMNRRPVLLITRQAGTPNGLPREYELLSLPGPYRVWGPGALGVSFSRLSEFSAPIPGPREELGPGIVLEGWWWEPGLLPPRLYLVWHLENERAWRARPELRLTAGSALTVCHPLERFKDGWPRRWQGNRVVVPVELLVPCGGKAGSYEVTVGVEGSPSRVSLGAVVLGPSKRSILLAFARGEGITWRAAAKTLLQL